MEQDDDSEPFQQQTKGNNTMFGKPKKAEDVLKLIEELPEEEFEKLLNALDEEEKPEETEKTAEQTAEVEEVEEETEEDEKTSEESEQTAENEEEAETEEVEETAEPVEEVKEEEKPDYGAIISRIDTFEDTVKSLAARLEALEEKKHAFGIEGRGDAEEMEDGRSEIERTREKYFGKF